MTPEALLAPVPSASRPVSHGRDAPADVTAPRACVHCGTPVPPAAASDYCCSGCELVHGLLRAQGLDAQYYRLRATADEPAAPAARPTDRTYGELDDPTFRERHVRTVQAAGRDLAAVDLYLEGVHCAACVWLVERLPRLVPGVVEARLDLGRSMASVTFDPASTRPSLFARQLDAFGYPVHPYRGARARDARRSEERTALVRIAVAGAIAGNVMLLSFALWGGSFASMEPRYATFFRWGCLLLAIPSYLGPGRVFLRGALTALRTRSLHMDLPIAIGLTAGLVGGAWNTLRGTGELYLDAVTLLIFLLLSGRWLERRAHRRASDAAELLQALAPSSARRLQATGEVREVPIDALAVGDRVEVRAGDPVPVDGEVEAGASELDASLLTGETRPRPAGPGDRVHAGTLNLATRLVVKVTETGEATRVGRLARLVEESARRRAPVVRLADRLAGRFVAVALLLAAAILAAWWSVDPARAIDHAVALLVVTCPCALGLATPLAVSVAIGRAARAGIVVKGGDVLERLVTPGRMWLDKTGTLTVGRARLVDVAGDPAALRLVLALEAASAHPVARALQEALASTFPVVPPCDAPAVRGKAGLSGRVEGHDVRVGAPAWVLEAAASPPPAWCDGWLAAERASARTVVLVALDGRVVAGASFGDQLRPDAAAALDRLRARGWRVGILSGDEPAAVLAVGRALGLDPTDCHGGLSPEDKLARVEASRREGPVVMVGDGVNDAAALAAATVGVGVHGGAEAALGAADVFVTRPGVAPVADLLDGADAALRTIRRNLAISLAYNVVGASLAAAGVITPWFAAILMPLSSLSVIGSSTRQHGASWR